MDPIIKLEGSEMEQLIDELEATQLVHTLRFAIDDGGVKVKINSGMWSPPLGKVEN